MCFAKLQTTVSNAGEPSSNLSDVCKDHGTEDLIRLPGVSDCKLSVLKSGDDTDAMAFFGGYSKLNPDVMKFNGECTAARGNVAAYVSAQDSFGYYARGAAEEASPGITNGNIMLLLSRAKEHVERCLSAQETLKSASS